MRIRTLVDGAPGDLDAGDAFTASIAERAIALEGGEAFLKEFLLSYHGDGSVAVVTIESFLDLVNPFTFKAGNVRINLRGTDIFALNVALFGNVPFFREGGSINDDVKVGSMRIPVNVLPTGEALAYSLTRAAVTNIATEELSLRLKSLSNIPEPVPGRIDAKEISFTTGGTTGVREDVIKQLPNLGRLIGVLFRFATVPTDTAKTCSLQRVEFHTKSGEFLNLHCMDVLGAFTEYYGEVAVGNLQDVLANYGWVEFRDEPIDLTVDDVAIKGYVGVATSAVRIIPVIEIAQTAPR